MPFVFDFDHSHRKPPMEMKDLLGGKGANLAEMTSVLGLPVPPGFTIAATACRAYMEGGWPEGLSNEIARARGRLEKVMGKRIGDASDPLLVSVRSGAKFSMPGMMDTVLNLGLNDKSVEGLASQTDDERFAYDSYRRFVAMYGRIVLGVPGDEFDSLLDAAKELAGTTSDAGVPIELLRYLVEAYQQIVERYTGTPFPQDPDEQLRGAIEAVFGSWNGPRAIAYRVRERIAHDLGTAVNVQAMVFGNRDDESGTGVGFTRDPATGAKGEYGDFLVNAQGEDVVAGIRNTQPLSALADEFPKIHKELLGIFARLEHHYRDMCDTEFTIEQGKLWMLQTRVGKRTGRAALRMAVDMVAERAIKLTRAEAVGRITGEHLEQVLHPQFAAHGHTVLVKGLGASPGAAVGRVYLTADDAQAAAERGEAVVLVRSETSPEDVHGMLAAQGILTARGGLVSHAAVVARGWGKPAVVGAEALRIGAPLLHRGRRRGLRGRLDLGRRHQRHRGPGSGRGLRRARRPPSSTTILGWADEIRAGHLGVRANADNGPDAANARRHGAEGIGLCRTEHMFLAEDRLPVVRRMILADTPAEEEAGPRGPPGGPAGRLRRDPRGHGRSARHHPPARPAAARVPARHHGAGHQGGHRGADRGGGPPLRGGQAVARVQPHARHPRRASGGHQARALRHAGPGPDGGRPRPGGRRRPPGRRDHDPPHRQPGRSWRSPARGWRGRWPPPWRPGRRPRRGRAAKAGHPRGPHRHDDRDAPGRPAGRRDRRGGRVLLVRDQRPHPDDVRLQPRRRRGPDDVGLPGAGAAQAQPVRGRRPRRGGRAGPPRRPSGAGPPGPTSRSASAASTAATPSRSPPSPRPGSTT